MNPLVLKRFELIYVGTPYGKYAAGIEAAFIDACKITARLIGEGLNVYSPIAHTHPIAIHGGINPTDNKVWLAFDAAMMRKSDAMIVAMLDGWDVSHGVRHEIEIFTQAGKPIYFVNPNDLFVSHVPGDFGVQA